MNYGVILRKLRELKSLPIKKAALSINRSPGWLSEIENNKGEARIGVAEFEKIVAIWNCEPYRKSFPIWVANSEKPKGDVKIFSFDGAILKYLRQKAKINLNSVAANLGVTPGYIGHLEHGRRRISIELRNRLLNIYGYSPSSFKNFTTADKRGKNIPARFKLDILLADVSNEMIERIYSFALEINHKMKSSEG